MDQVVRHRFEGPAVVAGQPEDRQGMAVQLGAITFMAAKTIRVLISSQEVHKAVAVGLRDDRSSCHRGAAAVALDEAGGGKPQVRVSVAIHKNVVRQDCQIIERTAHGQKCGLEDSEPVDFIHTGCSDTNALCDFGNFPGKPFTLAGSQFFGVIEFIQKSGID